MKAKEVLSKIKEKTNFTSLYKPKPREHYKFLMEIGRVFPNSKAQAQYFYKLYKDNKWLDPLYSADIPIIEKVLNKYGFEGNYKLTKSKRNVRLLNTGDLAKAFKKMYKF
jgi:hypothetical protein